MCPVGAPTLLDVRRQVAVGEHRRSWRAGGPAREDQHREMARRHVDAVDGLAGQQPIERHQLRAAGRRVAGRRIGGDDRGDRRHRRPIDARPRDGTRPFDHHHLGTDGRRSGSATPGPGWWGSAARSRLRGRGRRDRPRRSARRCCRASATRSPDSTPSAASPPRQWSTWSRSSPYVVARLLKISAVASGACSSMMLARFTGPPRGAFVPEFRIRTLAHPGEGRALIGRGSEPHERDRASQEDREQEEPERQGGCRSHRRQR